jgi:hypothetical protein
MFSQSGQSNVMGMHASARLASDRLKRMASRALKGIARSVQLGSGRCLGYARWKVTTKRAPQMENNAHLDRRPHQGLDLSFSSSVQSFTGPDLGVQSWASEFRNQQYIMHAKPFRKRFNDLKKKRNSIDLIFCLIACWWIAFFLWVNYFLSTFFVGQLELPVCNYLKTANKPTLLGLLKILYSYENCMFSYGREIWDLAIVKSGLRQNVIQQLDFARMPL